MPAAAKTEKPPSATDVATGKQKNISNDNANSNNANQNSTALMLEPPKIVNTILEKKIRNLEKRKTRLLEIKALEDKGQQLEADQKNAVKKLDNVVEMIDMLKEIGKNVSDSLSEFAKLQKKQLKKEQIEKQQERQQQELERFRLLLKAQFILSRLASAKKDLLSGDNGAVKLEESHLNALEQLKPLLCSLTLNSIESNAEKVYHLVEGNKRESFSGVTFFDLKTSLVKLVQSNYFDKMSNTPEKISEDSNSTELALTENNESSQNDSTRVTISGSVQENTDREVEVESKTELANISNPLSFMRDSMIENELQHKDPAVVAVGSAGSNGFTTYRNQVLEPSLPQPNLQPPNSATNYYPSPIYAPVSIASIPTQTFTNQNYTTLVPNPYIPITQATTIPHPQPMQPTSLVEHTAVHTAASATSEKNIEPKSEMTQQLAVDKFDPQTSQIAEGKPVNGHAHDGVNNGPNKRGPRRPRSNYNNSGPYRGGRGGKNFGYFGGGNQNGNVSNGGANFNSSRPVNRQSGGGGGNRGQYRQDRANGHPTRNGNGASSNINQQAPPAAIASK